MADVESSRMNRVADHSIETWSYDEEVALTDMANKYP